MKIVSEEKNTRELLHGLAGLVTAAKMVKAGKADKKDRQLTRRVQQFQQPEIQFIMRAISWAGYPPQTLIFYAAILAAAARNSDKRLFIRMIISLGGAVITGYTLKILINRPRPRGRGIKIYNRGAEGEKWSFPAGHVQAWSALLGLGLPRNSGLYLSLVGLMGLSRVYLGEHWTSDVTAAAINGSLWAGWAKKLKIEL